MPLDTSVFGGYYDDEFQEFTRLLFDKIVNEKIRIIYQCRLVKNVTVHFDKLSEPIKWTLRLRRELSRTLVEMFSFI